MKSLRSASLRNDELQHTNSTLSKKTYTIAELHLIYSSSKTFESILFEKNTNASGISNFKHSQQVSEYHEDSVHHDENMAFDYTPQANSYYNNTKHNLFNLNELKPEITSNSNNFIDRTDSDYIFEKSDEAIAICDSNQLCISKDDFTDSQIFNFKEYSLSDIDVPIHSSNITQFADVEVNPSEAILSENESPLPLEKCLQNFVPYASPFFHTVEFNPYSPTDIGILLKIMNHEFENLSEDEYDDGFWVKISNKIENEKAMQVPWFWRFLRLFNIRNCFHFFEPLTKEEYNAKFPWDKFYDPELYYDNDVDIEGGINMDMLPDNLENNLGSESYSFKRFYSYVTDRRSY